jgi:hypothetical protein
VRRLTLQRLKLLRPDVVSLSPRTPKAHTRQPGVVGGMVHVSSPRVALVTVGAVMLSAVAVWLACRRAQISASQSRVLSVNSQHVQLLRQSLERSLPGGKDASTR